MLVLPFGCKKESAQVGKSGSFARMNIVGNYLYTISKSKLLIHNITNPYNPKKINNFEIDNSIETLFTLSDKLLIGSSNGMFIYDLKKPGNPTFISRYSHFTACDPVVSQNNYAYVTLRNDSRCRLGKNELHILNIKNIFNPVLIKKYEMDHPHGLGIDNDLLFIAEGEYGLSIYNTKDPKFIKELSHIRGINSYDLILNNPYLFLIARDGLYIFDYHDFPNRPIKELSKITIQERFTTKIYKFYSKIKWWHLALFLYFALIIFYTFNYKVQSRGKENKYSTVIFWIILTPIILVGVFSILFTLLLLF